MARRLSGLVVMLSTSLTGCTSQQEAYCEVLAEEQDTLTDLAEATEEGNSDIDAIVESYERQRASAPDELLDEYDTVIRAFESLRVAIQRAGIDADDYDPGDLPPNVRAVADKLGSFQVEEAAAGIQDYGEQVCDVSLTE